LRNHRERFLIANTDEEKRNIITEYFKENPDVACADFLVTKGSPCGYGTCCKLFGKFSLAKKSAGIVSNTSDILERLHKKRK